MGKSRGEKEGRGIRVHFLSERGGRAFFTLVNPEKDTVTERRGGMLLD